ncbi:MAG: undecaprenyldiphospho-muramoylpentapeptide beta-N-acetylglucosaminyltransferase [Kordiimonadaceae bacterium]|nr:undecaprenyldiphospho-muramoylpentapeptide beta-N-acetylglucosaminyltransferase [Kordiimonadaceae bacterium]
MNAAPHIILAAGGTGGHMMPADAVADVLVEAGYKVSLITDQRGEAYDDIMTDLDRTILSATSHTSGGLVGKLKSALSILRGVFQVRKQFKADAPTVVVGFGGYPSLPAVLAAKMLSIPYILHEQNAVLGRVNRFMAKGAYRIALSADHTARVPEGAQTIVTGNPVRRVIAKLANIAYALPLGMGDVRIFIIGGSQGARILSDVVPPAIAALDDEMRERLDIIHQARAEDIERVKETYKSAGVKADVQSYFTDVAAILLRTQLVISRSGASTLAELTAMGRPAILVPLAIAVDDHQTANARIVAEAGGGWIFPENEFSADALTERLHKMLNNIGDLRDGSDGMRTIARVDAAQDLATLIINLCDGETEGS